MASPLPAVSQLVSQIEGALAHKFAGALTLRAPVEHEQTPTGIAAIDALLNGGFAEGGLSEIVGPESSGRTTVAVSLLAAVMARDTAAAWVDVSDSFDPQSATECGVDLRRLLWVRCSDASAKTMHPENASTPFMEEGAREAAHAVPRSGGSLHPRSEANGMSEAVASLLQTQPGSASWNDRRARRIIGTPGAPNRPLMPFPSASPYRGEQVPTDRTPPRRRVAEAKAQVANAKVPRRAVPPSRPHPSGPPKNSWHAVEKALRTADLLLHAGGFTLLVLDLGSVPAETAWRIPSSTWFRFRATCERTRTTMILLTQKSCAKSSADAVVRLRAGSMQRANGVLTGISFAAEMERERSRSSSTSNVIPMRKPSQSERRGQWNAQAAWAVGG